MTTVLWEDEWSGESLLGLFTVYSRCLSNPTFFAIGWFISTQSIVQMIKKLHRFVLDDLGESNSSTTGSSSIRTTGVRSAGGGRSVAAAAPPTTSRPGLSLSSDKLPSLISSCDYTSFLSPIVVGLLSRPRRLCTIPTGFLATDHNRRPLSGRPVLLSGAVLTEICRVFQLKGRPSGSHY